jgi:uncharacterized membrane protein YczE
VVIRTGLPRRLIQLYVGLTAYGASSALQVRAGLGLDPWDVFHQGVSRRVHISIGLVVIVVGALVLLAWIPLRQRPGLGTVSNVVVLGLALNGVLSILPRPHLMVVRIAYLGGGILLCGVATGMYIGARFGPGPRDGLVLGLSRRSRFSIRLVRTVVELSVLVGGWLLGGTVGVGTVIFALTIGPLTQLFLPLFAVPASVDPPDEALAAGGSAAERSADVVAERSAEVMAERSVVLVIGAGEPSGQPVDGHLEVGVDVDEGGQAISQPGQVHLVVAPPSGQLFDSAVGKVHG